MQEEEYVSEIQSLQRQLAARRLKRKKLEQYYKLINYPHAEEKLAKAREAEAWLLVGIGRYYRLRSDCSKARQYIQMALAEDPNNVGAFVELGRCYKEEGEFQKAAFLFKKVVELYPETTLGFMELAEVYDKMGQNEETFKIYEWVLNKKPDNIWIYTEIGQWFKKHGYYKQAEQAYLKAIEKNPTDYFPYEQLADIYAVQGDTAQAEKYAQKAMAGEKSQEYSSYTIKNYNEIADIILDRGIPLICMQYPLRSVEPLKKILSGKKGIVFVENKKNFERVLRDSEYSKVFSDNFAGDFGHCTRLGNRLIAENLANTILNLLE